MGRPLQPGRGQRPGSRVARVSIRDDLCNSGSWSRTARIATRGFNPLLHEATSATWSVAAPSPRGQLSVSIPYFTGRPLQRGSSGGPGRDLGRCFNPLLHGATSATLEAGGLAFRGEKSQSPTSRGDPCNRLQWSYRLAGEDGFNPLLHGATSATKDSVVVLQEEEMVSIPYFTGRPLQLQGSVSPSSIGGPFQSPTSRGDLCNVEHLGHQVGSLYP